MADTKQKNVRLSQETHEMIEKMKTRNGGSDAEVITKAVTLMWLITGGGHYAVNTDQADYVLRQTRALE